MAGFGAQRLRLSPDLGLRLGPFADHVGRALRSGLLPLFALREFLPSRIVAVQLCDQRSVPFDPGCGACSVEHRH